MVNIEDSITQQQKGNGSITVAQLDSYFNSFYLELLNDPAISGLALQVHWDTVNPNPPTASNAYLWNYVDDAFTQRSNGSYDTVGPTGNSLGFPTLAAKAGDIIELFGTGFGPTNPAVPAGQAFSGAAPTSNPVAIRINNVSVTPLFAGLSSAGLYQFNLTIPAGLGTGDVSLTASVAGVTTPSGVVISLQ